MTDVTWSIEYGQHDRELQRQPLLRAADFRSADQNALILYRTYKTPIVVQCDLKFETQNELVANIPIRISSRQVTVSDPTFEITNATIFWHPAKITPASLTRIPIRQCHRHQPDGTTAKIVNAFVPNEDARLSCSNRSTRRMSTRRLNLDLGDSGAADCSRFGVDGRENAGDLQRPRQRQHRIDRRR
jgi:hypothetical protein